MNVTTEATDLPVIVSVAELSRRWGMKESTIREWARRGILPSRKLGRLTVFDARELEAALEKLPRASD